MLATLRRIRRCDGRKGEFQVMDLKGVNFNL